MQKGSSMSNLGDPGVLPQAGTPPFFPAVLAAIRAAAPNLPLDPVVLQALLLCFLARQNLILRTREDDIGSVSKLAASTLTSVFGYPTNKLKIRPDAKHQTPHDFLRSVFLRPPSSPAPCSPNTNNDVTQSHRATHRGRSRAPPVVTQHLLLRSLSYPVVEPTTSDSKSSDPSGADLQNPLLHPLAVPSPSLAHDPSLDPPNLPNALVISGLENTGLHAQRALLKVLTEKTVIFDGHDGEGWLWNLPECFIVVYVCVADPRERPAIHKSLLDRFAMSTTINLHPSTQQAIHYTLSHHRHSVSPQPTTSSAPLFPTALLQSLRSLVAPSTSFSTPSKINIHPTLSLYISDLFSAARHHPQLDGMLLTARARKDVESLAKAERIIGGDLTGVEFIKAMGEANEEHDTVQENVQDDDDDVESLDIGIDMEHINGSSHDADEAYPTPDETLDVSEADIARIVPRVLSHRLRVRNGPQDEILSSLTHSAVPSCAECERDDDVDYEDTDGTMWDERPTVKDILVKILAEV